MDSASPTTTGLTAAIASITVYWSEFVSACTRIYWIHGRPVPCKEKLVPPSAPANWSSPPATVWPLKLLVYKYGFNGLVGFMSSSVHELFVSSQRNASSGNKT